MGACSADYDNDGWPDVFITGVGANKLYHNNGNGTFADVTQKAGVSSQLWSASCAFGDIDNDGDVDLYVTNYVDFSVDNNKYCVYSGETRVYCHPNVYNGVPDILYSNNGNGTFTDVSRPAGIYRPDGKGLGVVFGDYDGDGWLDIYVANDSTPNFLFHNKGKGVFEEVGLRAGVAVGIDGQPLAGMGTDMGDIDGDGLLDIIVTNLDRHHIRKRCR
jgi:enediyne biosynthesis protein E4